VLIFTANELRTSANEHVIMKCPSALLFLHL